MRTCASCGRHLLADGTICPFCGATRRTITAPWPTIVLVAGLALLASCADRTIATSGSGADEPGTGSSGAPGDGGSPDGSSTSGGPGDDGSTGTDDGWTTDGGWTSDDGCGAFYGMCPPDVPPHGECDLWQQDCPEGYKCMPWANDGGSSWNAVKCSPVDPDPRQPGEACSVEGSQVSGLDDCDIGSMCWDVDPDTLEGYCLSLCQGTLDSPTCPDPDTRCSVWNDGVLPLCVSVCDPLAQDCASDEACAPTPGSESFACLPDWSEEEGQYLDPCEYVNVCDPGLVCINADGLPDCPGTYGCCTEYCDLTAADPMESCSGTAEQGVECFPWFEEGTAPEGLEHVGVCMIPT